MSRYNHSLFFVFILLSCTPSLSSALVLCSGTLMGTTNDNVECDGNCVLDVATINGNVLCSTGSLQAKGGSTITGTLTFSGSVTSGDLQAVTVNGAVSVSSASSLTALTTTSSTTLGPLTVTGTTGDFDLAGTITSVSLTNSGDLFTDGLTATGGVTVTGGTGVVDICGSTLGSLTILQHTGNIVIDATLTGCAASTLSTGFSATKGTGDVTVKGADLSSSDFIVSEYVGNVVLQDADVSDLLVSKSEGTVTITNVDADSDTKITEHDGDVTLTNVESLGDFMVDTVTGDVVFELSDFGAEDAVFSFIDGDVTIKDNTDFSVEVKETGGLVSFTDNTVVSTANINKNSGGVSILRNTITTLSCSDNTPAPTGSGNTVTFSSGQCTGGFP